MANFCTKCGKRLIDGQPCSCTQQSVHDMQESVQKAAEEKAKETYVPEPEEEVIYEEPIYAETPDEADVTTKAKNFFTQAVEMIKHPSTGFVEALSDKDSKNGLILMGIEAILTGLYLYVLLQKIVSATMSGINSVFGTSRTVQTPSLGGYFGYGVIIAIIVSLVIAALVMGLMKSMAGADINWLQSCQIAGMRSLGLSLGWILGILGLFLGMYQFAILIVAVGGVLGMIYMIVAMMSYPDTKKDMIAYAVLITGLVATFVAYFVLKEFVLSSLINSGGSTTNFLNNIL